MSIHRITLKSDANVSEQDFAVRLPELGLVENGMIMIETAIFKNNINTSASADNTKMLYKSAGRHHSQINICTTSFARPETYDSRRGRETNVLKCIPLQAEHLIGADDGVNIMAMNVFFEADTLHFGVPIKSFDFNNCIINISLKDEDLALMTAANILFFQVTMVVVKNEGIQNPST